MKPLVKTYILVSLLFVCGCVPFWRKWKTEKGPTPATYSVLKPHESWCYKTLGQIDCYPEPQRLPPESLVSVDPPSRFPLTREEYNKALNEAHTSKK